MSQIHSYTFSEKDAKNIVDFARDTVEVYAKEGQKMDEGSVSDLLNMKAGLFLEIESTGPFGRVRGSAGSLGSQRLAVAIIESTVYAASERSLGSEVSRNELSDIRFKIAPIEEVKILEEPQEKIEIGREVPLFIDGEPGWIYPTDPEDYNWSVREYLERTCQKCDLPPEHWKDGKVAVARTRPITEDPSDKSIDII
jgi:AMMECR1 domain-containing protein